MERTFTRRDGTVGEVRRADGTAIGVGPEPTKRGKYRVVRKDVFRLADTATIVLSNERRKARIKAMQAKPRAIKAKKDRVKYGEAF